MTQGWSGTWTPAPWSGRAPGPVSSDHHDRTAGVRRSANLSNKRAPVLLEATGLVGWNVGAREDRRDRTLRLARATIDALVWVDIELILTLVDAIDGAHLHAAGVFRADARFSDDIGEWFFSALRLAQLSPECSSYPTDPSISSSMRRLSSTAYSSGSCFAIGSMNPRTISAMASSLVRPRLMR